MLFRKKIERSCAYCAYGADLGEGKILCSKRGFVCADGKCRKFSYDPCKRVPPRPKAPDFDRYTDADFQL